MLDFTGERIVPGAANCEPLFAEKMYQEHAARYLLAAQVAAGARVLDVGCGVGYGARLLARAGAKEVLAFDLSAEAIDHARQHFAHPVLRFETGDATSFRYDAPFDLITCFELIEHVPDQEAVFRCIAAALAPGGIVVMSTPRALAEKRTHFHTSEYSPAAFAAAFNRHFRHHRMLVENNHFASLITDGPPHSLRHVVPLHEQFALEQADYLIAVATQGEASALERMQPVLTLGNDAYVTLLERDVGILQERRIELEASLAASGQRHAAQEKEVAALRQARRELELRLEEARRVAEPARQLAATAAELERQQAAMATLLEEELAKLRLALADASQGDAQARLVEAERQLLAMRRSTSWRLTAPLRVLGTTLQQGVPGVARAMEYRRLYGGRAMARRAGKVLLGRLTGRAVPPTLRLTAGEAAPAPATAESLAAEAGTAEILILIGCWEGESQRYRVHNLAAALRQGGRDVAVLPYAALGAIVEARLTPRLVVLFRAPEEPFTNAWFAHAKAHGIRTVFDVDDLVFDPEAVPRVHGYRLLSPAQQALYRDGVARYRALLQRCDLVTVTTAPLARAAEALGVPARVVPNTWNDIQGELAERLLQDPPAVREGTVIGYFSGSRTHDRDFAEAAPALLRLLRERPGLTLRIVGELDPGAEFAALGERVERLPMQPYQQMLRSLRGCDINIAPLEPDNPFNEAKSELKWFEAALVGVPTVASPTEPFRAAIAHGRTGFLAADEAAWYAALAPLVDDPALRRRVGEAAREAALQDFSPARLRVAAEEAYGLPPPPPLAAPAISTGAAGRKRVDWIIPGLIIGGGGHRNILRAAHYLERFGHEVGLHFTGTDLSATALRQQLQQHFYPFAGEVRRYDGIFRYSDALFATHWSTVGPALRARGMTREVMYFVQDFEPLFSPMGTDYILAENTYRQGLYCITSGPWCERLLKREFGAEADHFEFPIDRETYFPRPRQKRNLNVVYFAKPEMPRRCYELGVMMLRELHALMPELEIIMYGSRNVDTGALGFPVTLRAVLPTIADLAQMYADADLGIAFSTTNPSLVPYEMMACGTPVVDLGRPGNEANYADRFDIALLADPEPRRMAMQVRDLLGQPEERAARSRAGLELAAGLPTEEAMARRVEELILKRLAR